MPSSKIALDLRPVVPGHAAYLDHGANTRLAPWIAGRRSTATAPSSTGTGGSAASWSGCSASSGQTSSSSATTSSSPRSRRRTPGASYREVLTIALERLASETGLTPSRGRDQRARASRCRSGRCSTTRAPGLTKARERGWKLAILSNTDRDLIDASMDAIGFLFDLSSSPARSARTSPRTGTGRSSTSGLGPTGAATSTSPRASSTTSSPATQLGLPSIWINRLGEQEDPRPDVTLDGVGELA